MTSPPATEVGNSQNSSKKSAANRKVSRIGTNNLYPNNLKYWIKERGYRLYEVAEEVGISPRTLTDYCAGRLAIHRDKPEAIAEAWMREQLSEG